MFKNITAKNILFLITLLVYFAVVAWVGIWHFEPWRDLAHVWVSVRDGSWVDVFTTIPAHSHPFLWFFLVKLLVSVGLPYQASIVLNILVCVLAIAVLLYKAPLPWWLKIIFTFSYPLLYEFSIPGRIYALGVLLCFLICAWYPKRHQKPILFSILIALSFHTHFLFLAFSAPILFVNLYENWTSKTLFKKSNLIGYGILLLSGLYLLWYLMTLRKYAGLLNTTIQKNDILEIFNYAFYLSKDKLPLLTLFTMLAFITAQSKKLIPLLVSIFAFGFMIYSYQHILANFLRYYQILPIVMICLMWLYCMYDQEKLPKIIPPAVKIPSKISAKPVKNKPKTSDITSSFSIWEIAKKASYLSFACCLLFSDYSGITQLKSEVSNIHSDAKNAADYIIKNNYLDHQLVGHRSYTTSAIVPYLPKDKMIWYADRQEYGTFLKFDTLYFKTNISVSYPQAVANAMAKFNQGEKVLLILSIPLPTDLAAQWQMVYASQMQPIQKDEVYFMYVKN